MQILGIESSCDETGIALYDTDAGLVAHVLHSQVDLHAAYGGVVPELASRDHIRRLCPLINELLKEAGSSLGRLDGIAYTSGPGLAGALLTGAMAARSLAWSLDIPALGVHHMEGHLLSPMLDADAPQPPFVCLLVSGGHSQLIRVDTVGDYRFLGDTLDDAAGEAFDKTAKMLGLPYPGGPHLAKLAESGDASAFAFPRPMTDRAGLDFSFSGLKTAAITAFRQAQRKAQQQAQQSPQSAGDEQRLRADIAASFEAAIVETLQIKCLRALQQEKLSQLVVCGGVSANRHLRERFSSTIGTESIAGQAISISYPSLEFCTDNGAMIALAGALRLQAGEFTDLGVSVRARWPLSELAEPGKSV